MTYIGSLILIPIIILMVANTVYTDYFMMIIGPASIIYLFYEMRNLSAVQVKKLLAALVFILFSIFFWAFYEQSGGSLSLFAANNLQNKLLGYRGRSQWSEQFFGSFIRDYLCRIARDFMDLDGKKENRTQHGCQVWVGIFVAGELVFGYSITPNSLPDQMAKPR